MCFPMNFAKFIRTPFLQNTSGGCFLNFLQFVKDFLQFELYEIVGWILQMHHGLLGTVMQII